MKLLFVMILPLLLCAVAHAGDFTLEWEQSHTPHDYRLEVLAFGQTSVYLKSLPPPKKNDAPRAALLVGDRIVTKTPIYCDKPYHFALIYRDNTLRFFLNGFPEPTEQIPAPPGEITDRLKQMKLTQHALSDEQILRNVKAKITRRDITIVGHRGVHKHAPENTKISYVQALEAKTPIVEIDTALTKDGQIILMHDKTVDRTTNGTGAVADLTADEITKLDAGEWKNSKYKGEPVPRLTDIADLCRGKAIMMLDLKAEGQGKAIADWLASSRFPRDQVLLAPWTDEEGAALRQHVKDVPMIRLTSKVPTDTIENSYFARMKQTGFSGFSVSFAWLSEAFVKAAQKNGMKVYVWTVNDSPEIAGAALLGVDGIITDDPAATMKLVAQVTDSK